MTKKRRGKRAENSKAKYVFGQERFDDPSVIAVITDENRAFMDYRRAINRYDRAIYRITHAGTKEQLEEFMRENPEPVRPPGITYESGIRELWIKREEWGI